MHMHDVPRLAQATDGLGQRTKADACLSGEHNGNAFLTGKFLQGLAMVETQNVGIDTPTPLLRSQPYGHSLQATEGDRGKDVEDF